MGDGEEGLHWTFIKLVVCLGSMYLAFVYMPGFIRNIPVVRALLAMSVGGWSIMMVELFRSAFFPKGPFDRMFYAMVATLVAFAWHKAMYKAGLVDTDVVEHYGALTEAREAELKDTQ